MKMGLSKDQITQVMDALLASGSSPADILLFLQGLLSSDGAAPGSPTPAQIVERILSLSRGKGNQYTLKDLVTYYAQIAAIPGAGRLLERLIVSPYANNGYSGYLYELKWCAAHKDQIARIEDIDSNRKPAADVVMKSGPFTKGAIVDTKSWKETVLTKNVGDLLEQIQRDQSLYPGYPIVLVFDAKKLVDSNGNLLPGVASVFKKLSESRVVDGKTIAGATIMTSPPDTVWDIGQEPLPGAHTTPTRLLQSGANVAIGSIEAGQAQPPQQLPPGQTNPPLELPPMELPPQH